MIRSATETAPVIANALTEKKEIALVHEILDACLPIEEKARSHREPLRAWDCLANPKLGAQVAGTLSGLVGCQVHGAAQIPAARTVDLIRNSPDLLEKAQRLHKTAGEQLLLWGGSCFGYVSDGLISRMSRETGQSREICRSDYFRSIDRGTLEKRSL